MFADFVVDLDGHRSKHSSFIETAKTIHKNDPSSVKVVDLNLPEPPRSVRSQESSSKLGISSSDYAFQSSIVMSLKKKKLEQNTSASHHKNMSFDRILLKFDRMHNVVLTLKDAFDKYANSNSLLNRQNLINAVQYFNKDASSETINRIFDVSDLDTSRMIDIREFITAMTIATALDQLPLTQPDPVVGSESNANVKGKASYKEIREMLSLITTAYLIFDPDCKGYIERYELQNIIQTQLTKGQSTMESPRLTPRQGPETSSTFLSEERWNEMDWDANGCVDYAEFACTFAGWALDIDSADNPSGERRKSLRNPNRSSLASEIIPQTTATTATTTTTAATVLANPPSTPSGSGVGGGSSVSSPKAVKTTTFSDTATNNNTAIPSLTESLKAVGISTSPQPPGATDINNNNNGGDVNRKMKDDISRALKNKKLEDDEKYAQEKKQHKSHLTMDKILLKFDKMNKVFKEFKSSFHKYANKDDKTLTRSNLVAAIRSLHEEADIERIHLIFEMSDVDTSRAIDFKEFLTALTIAMVLNELPPSPKAPPESLDKYNLLREALGQIVSAYLLFDPDCVGNFNKNTDHKKVDPTGGFLTAERWNELVSMVLVRYYTQVHIL